jgi:hypothetical protein
MRVFENKVLRRMYEHKGRQLTKQWRKLRNEELKELSFSPNIVRVIKSNKMRWVAQLARMGSRESYTVFWWGYLRERDHLEDTGIDGRLMLRWIFRT